MQDSIRELIGRRKNRAIAIILTCKEDECDDYLPEESSYRLRKVVMDQLNELHDLSVDIIESLSTGSVTVNDLYLAKIEEKLDYIAALPALQNATESSDEYAWEMSDDQ